jgi:hypothetical protein
MKVSSVIPAVAALALGAVTSANAAMPVPRANGGLSIVPVDCAYGWYRGPDGQCYPVGYGARGYYGNRGQHRGWYQGQHRGWYRDYDGPYPPPYRAYPYYGGYQYYQQPYGYGEDDE